MKRLPLITLVSLLLVSLLCSMAMAVPTTKGTSNAPGLYPKDDIGRIDIIHYAKSANPSASKKADPGYKLMGVKWPTNNLPVTYAVNPANSGMNEADIQDAIIRSVTEWDNYTSRQLFSDAYAITDKTYGVQDNTNTIAFGPYADNRAIAVTSVWYIRSTGTIVEFDMIFNTAFQWGNAEIDPTVMDLQNIATHELGHSVGLADVYTAATAQNTMYGYSLNGEMKKRTLETPDWLGLQKLYGI